MPRRTRRGFSLIEVMVSAVVLGIGVAALWAVYSSSARSLGHVRLRDLARRVVDQRLEILGGLSAAALPACGGPSGCRDPGGDMRPDRPSAAGYPCTQWVHQDEVSGGAITSGPVRIDTVIEVPSAAEQSDQARVLEVSACWQDGTQRILTHVGRRLVLEEDGR